MTAMVSAASTLVKPTSKLAGALSDLKEGFMCLGHLDIDDAKNEEAFHSNQYLEVIVSTLAKVCLLESNHRMTSYMYVWLQNL